MIVRRVLLTLCMEAVKARLLAPPRALRRNPSYSSCFSRP